MSATVQILSKKQALDLLAMDTRQAEFYADRVAALQFLMPKTSPAERAAAKAFKVGPSYSCSSCGKHHFPAPTLCFWCRR